LKGTSWVELPVIHVLPKSEWERGVKEGRIVTIPLAEPRGRDQGWPEKLRLPESVAETSKDWGEEKKRTKLVLAEEAIGALKEYDSEAEQDDDAVEVGEGDEIDELVGGDEIDEEKAEEEEDKESTMAALFSAVDIPGGPEMLLKVGEALAKDFVGA
jgi:hypothetical protein